MPAPPPTFEPTPWWLMLPAGYLVAAAADHWHRRIRGFLPEDPPGGPRKRHRGPVPMVGFVIALVASGALLGAGRTALAGATLLTTWLGYADDAGKAHGSGADWRLKALLQAVAAALVCGAAGILDGPAAGWLLPWTLAWVLINAVNFLDNTDGVAASVGGVGVVLATAGWAPDLGGCGLLFLGFLPLNWPRPRLFLGDGGAYPLGALLAAAALLRGRPPAIDWQPVLATTLVPLLDFVQVVGARLWLGYRPWIADRRHLTHIVAYLGVPPVLVAPLFLALVVAAFAVLGG